MIQEWYTFVDDRQPIDDKPLPNGDPDPVKQYADGWYFYDETWASCFGPYPSRQACVDGCDLYAVLMRLSA